MKEEGSTSVMLVTGSAPAERFFRQILPRESFSPILSVRSAGEARRKMVETPSDIIMIYPPLPDEMGVKLAVDLSLCYENLSLLLIVKNAQYEQVAFETAEYGILTLPEPAGPTMVLQSAYVLAAVQRKLKKLEQKAESLREKMDEIKLVNRAKLILVAQLKMSEQEAHRFIEKSAMDRSLKRRVVAESIIRTYEN